LKPFTQTTPLPQSLVSRKRIHAAHVFDQDREFTAGAERQRQHPLVQVAAHRAEGDAIEEDLGPVTHLAESEQPAALDPARVVGEATRGAELRGRRHVLEH
jgi:hypothetical protein